MSNLIHILPEHVANQIAAGEVVQRPASMVKELMENAVDAGAQSVSVVVRDGGKSLVQVIDDGSGMSAGDAAMAFARHATSKISRSKDLFSLHTFGFRGEALASIASVAEVELRTRRSEDEVGTAVTIAGGTDQDARVEQVSCPKGTQVAVRNLFFNTPARRKFLKSDATETKQILAEFQRVALCHPDRAFSLVADDKTLLNLIPGTLHSRIVALVGRRIGSQLIDVEVDTPIVRLKGYIGLPATAKKGSGEQFFFVNGRYFRSSYLQKAVVTGYNKLLPFGYTPSYFIYIEVDPSRIDVNIHPQKTEIKFEDEQAMWQIISSAVGRSLGKHNVVPMLDFDNPTPGLEIPVYNPGRGSGGEGAREMPGPPPVSVNTGYNPFKSYDREEWNSGGPSAAKRIVDPEQVPFTEMIPPQLTGMSVPAATGMHGDESYQEFLSAAMEEGSEEPLEQELDLDDPAGFGRLNSVRSLRFGNGKYVVTTTADGLVVIDAGRAMLRINYERLLARMDQESAGVGQRELFPETIELTATDHFLLMEHAGELSAMGFDLRDMGGSTVVVYGLPAEMTEGTAPQDAVEELLCQIKQEGTALRDNHRERLAAALARSCEGRTGHRTVTTRQLESDELVRQLFACEEPNYTPDGRPVMTVIPAGEVDKRLKK